MAETVEHLMLEHLKRFQPTLERIEHRLEELTSRQTETHSAVLGLRRESGERWEVSAHLQIQLDRVHGRLDRIEHRLDLTE